ncbi:hypothetical protein BWQ96_05524 [Gracilariopsis chorda]|uniref:Uncharacterized protein n=1 Tax=Gracilariopsis chorda TaxID=448386 RepID=A0A2V3ISE3_9FLOR|nr:hypothetical protein BWQ96_05524 [Gracilariopsis chorda]|eukprot:PXF44667.1 hypothetical protein BWQ96_05524 [Gracilariopsis chorda]
MSALATIRTLWAKDPVVCFSCVIGAVGVAMPLFVPKLWGKYPDQIARDEQQAAAEAVRLDALRRAGLE